MDLSLSSLLAGLVFGIFGLYLLRSGRRDAHGQKIILGLALMIFPYFVESPWIAWPLGLVLVFLGYRV